MATWLQNIWHDDQGQDVAEYAVMLAVILVIVVGTIRLIGSNANNVFLFGRKRDSVGSNPGLAPSLQPGSGSGIPLTPLTDSHSPTRFSEPMFVWGETLLSARS